MTCPALFQHVVCPVAGKAIETKGAVVLVLLLIVVVVELVAGMLDVVVLVAAVVVVVVVGPRRGAHRSFVTVGVTVRSPNWSLPGSTGSAVFFGHFTL